MGEESSEMHSEDDKVLQEKNKKRIVKTRAQVQSLEKFYNEHKYPTESMKMQLAESIGLTEKQVSGWFCHRRLKDKKLMNGEINATGRQDRSSGAVQDRGSGHRQDSCGSTKQGDDRNFEVREVESGRLTPKEFSAADLTYEHGSQHAGNYNRMSDASSGSSSSLRNMSGHQNGDPFDAAASRYQIPKFPGDLKAVKPRSGPSGYLKVKRQVENASITAVKRQLGKHYVQDGPPLGVEFDPLPPGAFESSMQDPDEETFYDGGDACPASPDVSKVRQNPKFDQGYEFKSSMATYNSNIDGPSFKTRRSGDIPNSYIPPKYKLKTSAPKNSAYYPSSDYLAELPEGSARNISGSESRDAYGTRPRPDVEVMRTDSVYSHPNLQPYAGKLRGEHAESWRPKYNEVGTKISPVKNIENEYSNFAMKGNEYYSSGDKGLPRRIIQDGNMYPDKRITIENRGAKIPFKNELIAPKRKREDFPQHQHPRTSPAVDLAQKYQVVRSTAEVPSSFSVDEESAETSSSVD
ncbi:hypothetical protein CDL12_13472 [Handroanthus impetiginosus]|uniref:Homeobox domain-containing protein n=1 Tax=Handroanthus impetiginosus TaxID=429701 RepID=A0A2G9H8Q2_9LAMI|nr:hypothetical protein CDL12_13472 [Handroanthus impetiginosus]